MLHIIKHFWTITHHRHLVIKHCFKVGIGFQGLFHDLSKYSPTEFFRGAKYYTGSCSPNAIERKEKGYSLAWMHHKGRNKHHFEYWTDIVDGVYAPVLIPIRYLKESLCDRVAASKVYLKKKYYSGAALDYFNTKEPNDGIHPKSAEVLKLWLEWIATEGEKVAFRKIKRIKSYDDMLLFRR